MSTVQDPAGAGAANVVDATTPTFTGKNALVVAVSNTGTTGPTTPNAVRLTDGTSYYKATTPADTQPVSGTVGVTGSVAVTGPLTDTQLRASAVPVSGTVGVTGSVAVTGPLTDTQLRASAVPVSGPLTDAQIRATALPVSGTVGITGSVAVTGPLTDTQLRASAVPVSAASLPLPTGAATSAAQTTGNASLSSIDSKTPTLVSGRQPVDGSGVTQPISAASLPLPTGAATETTQLSNNTLLNTIATNTATSSLDFTATGSIAALNGAVAITGQGVYTVTAAISGTFVATLVAEGQMADNTWVSLPMYVIGNILPYAQVQSLTAAANVVITGGGYLNVRIRASAYTSGTIAVALDGSLSQQTIFSAQLGSWSVSTAEAQRPTYVASATNLAAVTAATDIFVITGSATKVVRVTRVEFSANATTAVTVPIQLVKRSTADTAGTSAAVTATPMDSNDAAATATVRSYTANPTLGTAVGTPIRAQKYFATVAATAAADTAIFPLGEGNEKAIVLRGVAQQLAINLNGTAIAGASVNCMIEWTEDNT